MITAIVNIELYRYEIHSLLKAFYPQEDVKVITRADVATNRKYQQIAKEPFLRVVFADKDVTLAFCDGSDTRTAAAPEGTSFAVKSTLLKTQMKHLLYGMLAQREGHTLPWGELIGIRPTKIAMQSLLRGESVEQAAADMEREHLVSPEKAMLSAQIAQREREILAGIHYEKGYSLYVGIPFCPTTCLYCSFPSFNLAVWKDRVDDYLDALEKEMKAASELMRGRVLDTVYIGGGTPTTLDPGQLERLFSMLEKFFPMEDIQEFTIEAGRPVLCETPIALTAAEAESLFSLSSSLDVLVVEAVHIRFLPFFKQIVSVISSGAVGTPVMLTANMAADMENLPRLQRPSLGGGALGDMGYFLLNFSSMIFGDQVKRIQSSCVFTPARVDRQLSTVLQYKDDRMAVLSCTTSGNGESRAVLQGTKGYMVIEDLMNFASVTVYDSRRNKTASYKRGRQKSEFEFELAAFVAAMKSGWKECPEIPHAQTISVMHMMDFIRRQLGISYEDIQTSPLPDLIAGSISTAGADPAAAVSDQSAVQQPDAITGSTQDTAPAGDSAAEPEEAAEIVVEAEEVISEEPGSEAETARQADETAREEEEMPEDPEQE